MSVLALIPARYGSKRVPHKNRAVVNGRTLVERAILAAKGSRVNEIVLSTDDPYVLDCASIMAIWGIDRPAELAQDDTPMAPVVRHALDEMQRKMHTTYEYLVILEPPATFRRSSDIDFVLDVLKHRPEASGIRTVTEIIEHFAPHIHRVVGHDYLQPVNAEVYGLPGERYFRDNGLVNIIRCSVFNETGALFDDKTIGLDIFDPGRTIDIDTPADLALAQLVASTYD